MRNDAHYRDLMSRNPNASVGFTLAASAVYAALHGDCETEEKSSDAWVQIAHDLKSRYGENLTADEVLAEMNAAQGSPQRTERIMFRVTPAERNSLQQSADEQGVKLGQYIRSKLL